MSDYVCMPAETSGVSLLEKVVVSALIRMLEMEPPPSGLGLVPLSIFQLSSASCVQRIFISSLLLSYSSSGPFPGDNLATHRKWQCLG